MFSACYVITRRFNSSGNRFCVGFFKTLITQKGGRGVEGLLSAILLHVFKFLKVGQQPTSPSPWSTHVIVLVRSQWNLKQSKFLLLQYDMKERFHYVAFSSSEGRSASRADLGLYYWIKVWGFQLWSPAWKHDHLRLRVSPQGRRR